MAVTQNKKLNANQQATQKGGQGLPTNLQMNSAPYQGMAGVSENTGQHMANLQQGYHQGQNVAEMQNVWQQLQQQKPGDYQSRYGAAMDSILQQIQNPQEFKYEFNGDNLFKGYADLYRQKAKQGMQDAMGQAAALTGGYGNSYAQAVGQQQYQQNMLGLYDKGLELYDRARQAYENQRQDLYNQYGVISGREQSDYDRYQDALANWRQDESTAYGHWQDAQSFDYNMYQNDLNYWTGLAQVENQAYQTQQQYEQAVAQYKQQYAWDQCQAILANGQMPSAALLQAAGLSAADAAAMMAQMEPAGSGGGGSGSGGGSTGNSKPNLFHELAHGIQNGASNAGGVPGNIQTGIQNVLNNLNLGGTTQNPAYTYTPAGTTGNNKKKKNGYTA